MKYKKSGNSNLEVSLITFGAWAAGGWMWAGKSNFQLKNLITDVRDMSSTLVANS